MSFYTFRLPQTSVNRYILTVNQCFSVTVASSCVSYRNYDLQGAFYVKSSLDARSKRLV